MSDSSDESDGSNATRVFAWVERYYHVILVGFLVAFMFWLRTHTWGRFVQDGEVLFSGNDPWYHYRQVSYTVEHWPGTMPFDPWTYFPHGNASGQFGTLYDQIMATVALVVGLGNPDQGTVALVTLFAPAVLGALVAIPTYLIGKRLGGRFGGVVAVAVLALQSGRFLRLSLVGFSDHHVAETLFQTVAILGVMVALGVVARDRPVYEQLLDRDIDPLRPSLGWAALAGLSITLYLWVWPYGAFLLGILGVFFVVQMWAEFLRGESPEHTAFAGAVALTVTGVLVLSSVDVTEFTASEFSLLQPAFAFAVVIGCVFVAWLARVWERRDLPAIGYPIVIAGTVVVGFLGILLLLPDLFDTIANNVVRVFGFWIDPSETGRTVGEVQPPDNLGVFFENFGFAIIVAAGGAMWIVGRTLLGRRVPPEQTLVVVWAFFLAIATLTQQRFGYYLVVPIAALTGYVIGGLFRWLDLSFDPDDVEFYQVLSVVAVVLVVVFPLVIGPSTAVGVAANNGPGQDIEAWSESLGWMQDNTPEEGLYADDETDLEFYGTYGRTDDFEYEPGSYGVLSWWDYGHWITQQGERIPHANPHQQGATTAANFLVAGSEEEATDVLRGIDEDEDAKNRYVMVDWMMAESTGNMYFNGQTQGIRGKFFAPLQFADRGDPQRSDYYRTLYYNHDPTGSQSAGFGSFNYHTQAFYETQAVRLYEFHGSAAEPEPVVLEWDFDEFQGQQLPMTYSGTPDGAVLQQFDTMEQARTYAENNSNAQVGGLGAYPSERVPALEHFRLVSTSEKRAMDAGDYQLAKQGTSLGVGSGQLLDLQKTSAQWTKVFERVEGATVEGSGPADATVRGQVEMYNPAANETFTYHQTTNTSEDGTFEMTVPYSTAGYDEWGPENGRTNVSVRATGEYSFEAIGVDDGNATFWNGSAHVPEAAVIGEGDDTVSVELTEIEGADAGQEVGDEPIDSDEASESGESASVGSEATTGDQAPTATPDDSNSTGDAGLRAEPSQSIVAP